MICDSVGTELRRLRVQPRGLVIRSFRFLRFSPIRLCGTSGRPDVSINAKTNGNRWERRLACGRAGLKPPQR